MSPLPSIQGQIRDNVVAAILALPNWPSDVPVEKLGIPPDAFQRGYRTMVGVCLTDDTWTPQAITSGLGDYNDKESEIDLAIVVYSTSEASPSGALESDDGMIDGLVTAILGSNRAGYGPGIRAVDLGVAGVTGGLHLIAVKTQIVADAKRAEGSGGALAKVIMCRTTALAL